MVISQIPTLRVHIWQVRSGHIYPNPHSDFTDSYSERSYLADQVLRDLPSQMAISQNPTLRVHIWQTRSWQIYPLKWQFHRFLIWKLIFHRSELDISTPIPHSDFTDSYSENSYLAGQVWRYLPQSPTVISQIPTLRAHIWETRSWQIYPSQVAISQIPTPRTHIWQTRSWQIYPPQVAISQIPNLRTHIWKVRSGHIYPNPPQWFHRFLLWEFIFGRPGLGRSTSPLECSFYRFLLWELIFGQPFLGRSTLLSLSQKTISQIPTLRAHVWQARSWQIYPYPPQVFHRFLLWEFIFGRPGLGRSTSPLSAHFTDFFSESWYLDNHFLVDPPFSLCLNWQFHRFLL